MVIFLIGMVAILTALSLEHPCSLRRRQPHRRPPPGHRRQRHDPWPPPPQHHRRPITHLRRDLSLSYTGAAVPSLIAGQLSHTLTMTEIALGYGGLALAATLITVIAARNPEPSSLTGGDRSA